MKILFLLYCVWLPFTNSFELKTTLTSTDPTTISQKNQRSETAAVCDGYYRNIAYYINWAIYGRAFYPRALPVEKLTHVFYAFANVSSTTGQVSMSDPWADFEIPLDSLNSTCSTDKQLLGCMQQMNLLKIDNRNLKVLLAIGGADYSQYIGSPVSTQAGRHRFTISAISLLQNFGFDGFNIDWQYPQNENQANDFVALLEELRSALDGYGNSLVPEYRFELTVAAPVSEANYMNLKVSAIDQYVDFWNLMAYDYSGVWSAESGHQANIFAGTNQSTVKGWIVMVTWCWSLFSRGLLRSHLRHVPLPKR